MEIFMLVFQSRFVLSAAGVVVAAAIAGCNAPPAAAPPAAAPAAATLSPAERGKMLVIGGGCHDCHTTKKMGPNGPEPDMSMMLAGHPENIKITAPYKAAPGSPWKIAITDTLTAWSGDWGVSFAANLTPDPNTGIKSGVWTEDLFVKALQTGKHIGTSRDILPPMPWYWYGKLPEDDLRAIYAYLLTIPPVNNHVPDPIPPAGAPKQ
jgi:mono/diheme cytochrome c family protein